MVLLSIFAFSIRPRDRMMRMLIIHTCIVIIWSCALIVGLLKYFLIFGGFARFDSDRLVLSSYGAFVHFCFSLSAHVIAWRECWLSTLVSADHGIVHLDCWSIKIFSHFWGFCPLWFWSFGAFVHFCFLCPPTWWHDENVDYPYLDHVIIWSCALIVGVLKYFLIFGRFCPLWFWSFGAFVLWCFCPILLFSVRPSDCMMRMLIVHTCIRWSWDRTPWLLEY